MSKTTSFVSALLLLAGCGGSAEPATGPESTPHEGGEAEMAAEPGHDSEAMAHDEAAEGAPDDHGELAPGLQAFHDAFAPIWHADPGPERTTRACEAAGELQQLAGPAEAEVPETDSGIEGAVEGLQSACEGGGEQQAVQDAMVPIHDAFHALIEAAAPAEGETEA